MSYYKHNLNPVAFDIFGFEIKWYALVYVLGFIFIPQYIKFIVKRKKLDFNLELLDDLAVYTIIGVIIGARLGFVFFYDFSYYWQTNDWLEIFKVYHGGLSFHTGVLGGALGIYFFSKSNKANFFLISDLICINLPILLFLGRIANFINGELYGKPTNIMFGVIFDDNIVRHPSQIYEALTEGLLIAIILNILSWKYQYLKQHGKLALSFIILYAIIRFFNEFFRESEIYSLNIGANFIISLTTGQILCVIMLLSGMFILYRMKVSSRAKQDFSQKSIVR